MSDKKFELGDYVEVKDRIKLFYELFGQGRLVTGDVRLTSEPDGVPRVMVQALAYRTPDDEHPGVGWSWLELPGKTPYTRGSEIENAETSAWGRAIGSLGILIDRSIASANEVQNKQDDRPEMRPVSGLVGTQEHPVPQITADGGLIGTAVAEGKYDFGLRQTPTGHVLPFRVKNGTKSFIALAENELAEAMSMLQDTILGQRVTVWGHWTDETIPAKGTKPEIRYRILHLDRIATPDGILPAPAVDSKPEALPPPLFDDSDMASLDQETGAA